MTQVFSTPLPLLAAGQTRTQLRQILRQLRETLAQRPQRELALDHALARELRQSPAACIGAYCASRDEYDVLRVLLRTGEELGWPWRVALPVVHRASHGMRFHAWRPGEALRTGAYGIAEPAVAGQALEPDLLLVPCLGFTRDGLRLGYGGGYYDRYLEHRPQVRTVGLAFEPCRIEDLQPLAHDRLLDVILTDGGRYGARPGAEPAAG